MGADPARAPLSASSGGVGSAEVEHGRPGEALIRCAIDEGYELIAIGRRGRGASKAVMGSTASRLARGAEVPVLVV